MKSQIITLTLIIICASTATLSLLLVASEFKEPSVKKIYILLLFSASISSGIIANNVAHDSR